MPVLFMGGEPTDFLPYGNVGWEDGVNNRNQFSRGSLRVDRSQDSYGPFANEWVANFTQPSGDFWFSFWLDGAIIDFGTSPGKPAIGVRSEDGKIRMALGCDTQMRIQVISGADNGSLSVVHTASHVNGWQGQKRFDVYVKLGDVGRVKVFVGGVINADYTGPIGGTATQVNQIALGNGFGGVGGWTNYSEIFATTTDSRNQTLKTHYAIGEGSHSEWDGSSTDIDDPDFAASADVISTETSPTTSAFMMNDLNEGEQTIRAFKLAGVFGRGVDAVPHAVRLGLGDGDNLTFTEAMEVDTGTTWLSRYWETNPLTGMSWTMEDINNLQMAIRSEGFPTAELPVIFDGSNEGGGDADEDFGPVALMIGTFDGAGQSGQSFEGTTDP